MLFSICSPSFLVYVIITSYLDYISNPLTVFPKPTFASFLQINSLPSVMCNGIQCDTKGNEKSVKDVKLNIVIISMLEE